MHYDWQNHFDPETGVWQGAYRMVFDQGQLVSCYPINSGLLMRTELLFTRLLPVCHVHLRMVLTKY